ncbi:hypothetical protein CDL15_Pgr015968 [Punica granatum]|nr:hypothetical protein CDL15_Pgr015968 [Punica granatum]
MGSDDIGQWRIEYIPDKPPVPPDQQPTVDVVASPIDPKFANAIVRRLNQVAPLENLRHVKRVQKKCLEGGKAELSVVLCIVPDNGDLRGMPPDVQELISSYQLSTFTTKVCKYAALSKEEWEAQCKLWPTSYHPPTYNISGITGFSEDDSRSVFSFMKYAVELATSGNEWVVNAAVIVDPISSQVIASACDQVCHSHGSPARTSAEPRCYGQVAAISAKSDVNGRTDYDSLPQNASSNYLEQKGAVVSCLSPWSWAKKCAHQSSSSLWHPLRHAAMVAIESSAERDRQLFPGSGRSEDMVSEMDCAQYSAGSPAKRQKTEDLRVEIDEKRDVHSLQGPLEKPYLCTGYDIYLAWEPCVMCAMALVHQRIRRIFYAFPNASAGALGSVQRLQGEKSLNHHYAVFRVFMPQDTLRSVPIPLS